MKIDLRGKRVWLTGASRGLGRSLALELTSAGARIALSARDGAALKEVAEECRALGGDVVTVEMDVTDAAACVRAAEEIVAELGGIDILVANAGISMWTPFSEIQDPAIFEKLMQVNYLGVVYCVRAALPHLRTGLLAPGTAPGGMIVNISSLQAWTGMPVHTGYGASKAAVQIFLDSLRMEAPWLHVLGIYPGWISGTSLRASALGADGNALGASRKSHNRLSTTAEECSRRIVRAMQRGKSSLYIPGYARLLQWLRPFAFPFVSWILRKATHSQKSTAPSQA
jgi:NAD(P)-dependent dehydrogenase (short-subunit alcohol dehydrogenase family)